MKWIIIPLLIIFIFTTCSAWEVNYFEIGNETISIIPTINICENTTNVFKIQRENYSVNSNPLELKYIQKTKTNTTKSTNITKIINKYTNSHTGNYTINENGNISLIFETQNNSLEWNFLINCFDINTTENTNNNTINETINESINITTNTSINLTNNTTINNTEDPETNNSENNSVNKTICPKEFKIKTNKQIFAASDKLEMVFFTDQWPKTYEITYQIELLDGTIVKKQYITTNNKTKTYTVKSSEQKEQTHKIVAKIESECGVLEAEKIIVVENQIETKPKEKTNISLKAEVENEELQLTIEAKRGDSSKSVINIFFENEKGKKIKDEIKVYLESKDSETKLIFKEDMSDEKIINIIVEGLGIYKELTIENDQFENITEIKNDKVEEEKVEKIINETKKSTSKIELENVPAKIEIKETNKVEAVKQKNVKKVTNILFMITLGSIIGIGTARYFRKHSAQKNL